MGIMSWTGDGYRRGIDIASLWFWPRAGLTIKRNKHKLKASMLGGHPENLEMPDIHLPYFPILKMVKLN